MRSTVSLSAPAAEVLRELDSAVVNARPGWRSAKQDILRAALVLGCIAPPSRPAHQLRRTLDQRGTVTPLLLDAVSLHALGLLTPRWFGTASAAVEWALLARRGEVLQYLTATMPVEQAEICTYVRSLT